MSVVIYRSKDGHIKLDVNIACETLWLSQQQMADLFGTKRQAVTKHLKNIFNSAELDVHSVSSKMEHTAADGKRYQTLFYSLDAVISVGYRVNSSQATQFRIWATSVLKDHLIRGYTTHEKRLAERGLNELQQSIELLQKTLAQTEAISSIGVETIQLIINYAKTWRLLLAYDQDELALPHSQTKKQQTGAEIQYKDAMNAIQQLKINLSAKNESESVALFGQERDQSFQGILGNIKQTFDGKPLYKTAEERAAHLFYFIIKDHPFSDGNKRIACLIFLLYLKHQNIPIKINDNGLVALALLIAGSEPSQKDLIIRLVVHLLLE